LKIKRRKYYLEKIQILLYTGVAAIYTYKGERGKEKNYLYKIPDLEDEILM